MKLEPTVSPVNLEIFSSLAAPEVLATLRQIAERQSRPFQSVLDDALREYIERQQTQHPRHHVMAAFASSLDEHGRLYQELAK
jgi:predicted transcriptional regulator